MTTYKDILCKKLKNIEHVKAVKKINENDNYQDESVKAHLIESSINSSATKTSIVSSIEQPQDIQKPVAKKYVRPVLPGARGSSNWEDDIEDFGEYLYFNFRKYYQHESAEKMVWLLADLKETELHKLCGGCQSSLVLLRHIAYKANEVLEAANANEYIVNNDKYIVRNGNKYIVKNIWFNSDLLKEMKYIIAHSD